MQWEYWTLKVKTTVKQSLFAAEQVSEQELDRQLNKAGSNGWELVNAMGMNIGYGQTAHILYTFKRPKS